MNVFANTRCSRTAPGFPPGWRTNTNEHANSSRTPHTPSSHQSECALRPDSSPQRPRPRRARAQLRLMDYKQKHEHELLRFSVWRTPTPPYEPIPAQRRKDAQPDGRRTHRHTAARPTIKADFLPRHRRTHACRWASNSLCRMSTAVASGTWGTRSPRFSLSSSA